MSVLLLSSNQWRRLPAPQLAVVIDESHVGPWAFGDEMERVVLAARRVGPSLVVDDVEVCLERYFEGPDVAPPGTVVEVLICRNAQRVDGFKMQLPAA